MAGSVGLACANDGAAVAWIAPTYKNSRPLWRFAERMTAPVAQALRINRAERQIVFPATDGLLAIYSADSPDSIRGEAFDLVILDEAARISQETWQDAIQPTLADRAGRAMLISTPKGRNWFWQEFLRAQADGKERTAFTAPTSANPNPNIRVAFERARELVPERTYRQEWLAEFVEDGGGVLRRVRECATAQEQIHPAEGHTYVFGVDWARDNDYTVISVGDCALHQQVALDRFSGIGYELQLGRLRALYDRFKPLSIVAEYNSMGGPLVERLQGEGLPVQGFLTTNASKAQIIEGLALAFEKGEITILPDETQIAELQAYEQERLPSSLIRYGAPEGMHDDTVIALALMYSELNYSGSFGRGI